MRLRYTRPALADLVSILDYIAANSPEAARKVHMRIRTVIDLSLRHPRIGSPTNDPSIRRLTISPYPYLVFYEATENEIVVHAVRHIAQNPSRMPGNA